MVSKTAQAILALLENASSLVVQSNKREEAKEVMRATVVFANEKSFPVPEEKFNGFYNVLLDSRPMTLSDIIFSIARDVLITDSEQKHV